MRWPSRATGERLSDAEIHRVHGAILLRAARARGARSGALHAAEAALDCVCEIASAQGAR
jgi:hypothetical protein